MLLRQYSLAFCIKVGDKTLNVTIVFRAQTTVEIMVFPSHDRTRSYYTNGGRRDRLFVDKMHLSNWNNHFCIMDIHAYSRRPGRRRLSARSACYVRWRRWRWQIVIRRDNIKYALFFYHTALRGCWTPVNDENVHGITV